MSKPLNDEVDFLEGLSQAVTTQLFYGDNSPRPQIVRYESQFIDEYFDETAMLPHAQGSYVRYEDVSDAIADMSAKLATADALVTCCCGSPVDTHEMGDGHSPVSTYHYHLTQVETENIRMREALSAMVQALNRLERILSYPVDERIQPRGYDIRHDGDTVEYAVEVIRTALGKEE